MDDAVLQVLSFVAGGGCEAFREDFREEFREEDIFLPPRNGRRETPR